MYKILFIILFGFCADQVYAQKDKADTRIDNLRYWAEMIKAGRARGNTKMKVPAAKNTGDQIKSPLIAIPNSTDVVIYDPVTDSTLSENTVAINPGYSTKALNANNTIDPNGLDGFYVSEFATANQGNAWSGTAFGSTFSFCDPATAISNTNKYYIGHMLPDYSQVVDVSTDEGANWTQYMVASGNGAILDKNHLWVDKSITSPYQNYIYSAWTDFGGTYDRQIAFSRSTDDGVSWSTVMSISSATLGGSHDQGVNLHTGPAGEVYAVWTIYDTWPSDETALGFASSTDGGATFGTSQRIITNIRGIRITGVHKNMRVNSFPSMAVDNSFGPHRGTIYVVWANVGTPGTNTGNDIDIYLIRSTDGGSNWSSPQLVNSKVNGAGKEHYFPWITCDQTTGKLHVIYYDDRDVSSTECETWMSSSFDGGATWSDYKISDVAFTPSPITVNPYVANGYFGDYIGVSANDDIIYPVWTDNRSGDALAYTSPLISNDFCPFNLNVQNVTMPLPAIYKYRAENNISIAGGGTNFVMQGNGTTGARASMVAGNSITLSPGTHIQAGAELRILPGPCSSTILRINTFSKEPAQPGIQTSEPGIGESGINIYPNPANTIIYVKVSKELNSKSSFSYVLTDLVGRVILTGYLNNSISSINTEKLLIGGYLLIIYENEKFVEARKIIKK